MISYNDFLINAGVIEKKDFDELLNSMPHVDYCDFSFVDVKDINDIAECLWNAFIDENTEYCHNVYADVINHEITISGYLEKEELENIKSILSESTDWKIENYDELYNQTKEEELINRIEELATCSDLENFLNILEQKNNEN